jgi:hypothetical protein
LIGALPWLTFESSWMTMIPMNVALYSGEVRHRILEALRAIKGNREVTTYRKAVFVGCGIGMERTIQVYQSGTLGPSWIYVLLILLNKSNRLQR